nr:hypothetical protein [Tanacetum cinerariifolium]
VQEVVEVFTTAKIITEVVTAASETITTASTTITAAEAQVHTVTLTTTLARVIAAPSKRRKRVVIRDPQEESTTSIIISAETKSKDKAKFNSNMAFLLKTKEQIEEEESKALKRLNETPAEKAAKRRKLDEETLLRNFDREDLEALWSLVKERFSTTKPKNFSNDFWLMILRAMFEKPDIHAQVWKNQRSVHDPTKVKGWKLLESCALELMLPRNSKKKHVKCLMLLVKDIMLPSQNDAVD